MKKIKQIRLKHYDYSSNGYYFVTVVTNRRQPYLTATAPDESGNYAKAVQYALQKIRIIEGVNIDYEAVMPNHVHLIIVLDGCNLTLSEVVRRFKAISSKMTGIRLWQPNYCEHVIRDEKTLDRIREYVVNNPAVEKIDFKQFYNDKQRQRRLMNQATTVAALCFLLALPVWAARVHPKAGATAASFLKIAPSARAVGMGESFIAVSDDASSVWWNPAGLASIDHREFTAMHNESFQDLRYEFIGYVHPLISKAQRHKGTEAQSNDQENRTQSTPSPLRGEGWGEGEKLFHHALGISAYELIVKNDLERRSGLGESDALRPLTASEGAFGANDLAVSVSYGAQLPGLALGATAKLIQQVIDDERERGVSFDFGAIYRYRPNVKLGFVIQNVGEGIRFFRRTYRLPTTYKIGAAMQLKKDLLLAFDFVKPIDNFLKVNSGLEYKFYKWFTVRGGYGYRLHGNDLGGLSGLTLGAGMSDFILSGYNLDYAFNPAGDLGNTHRISLTVKLGSIKP